MLDSWIGHIKLTSETEVLDAKGNKIHDYLEMGQTFDEVIYPVLYAKLGTNVLGVMAAPTGSPHPYKIIADKT